MADVQRCFVLHLTFQTNTVKAYALLRPYAALIGYRLLGQPVGPIFKVF
jgi:hypothetical protein